MIIGSVSKANITLGSVHLRLLGQVNLKKKDGYLKTATFIRKTQMCMAKRMKRKTRGPWATMLSYKSLIQHFRLSIAMATKQNEEFVQLLYAWWRTTQQTFIKKVLSKYLQWDSNKDLLSSQRQRNHMSNSNKKQNFCRHYEISAKFQLHPPYGFWGDDFEYFFSNLSFGLPWQPIRFSSLDKIHMFGRGLLKEHFC